MLPITPYPTVLLVFGPAAALVSAQVSVRVNQGLRAEEKPYTRRSEPSKTFGAPAATVFDTPIRRAAQMASPR